MQRQDHLVQFACIIAQQIDHAVLGLASDTSRVIVQSDAQLWIAGGGDIVECGRIELIVDELTRGQFQYMRLERGECLGYIDAWFVNARNLQNVDLLVLQRLASCTGRRLTAAADTTIEAAKADGNCDKDRLAN